MARHRSAFLAAALLALVLDVGDAASTRRQRNPPGRRAEKAVLAEAADLTGDEAVVGSNGVSVKMCSGKTLAIFDLADLAANEGLPECNLEDLVKVDPTIGGVVYLKERVMGTEAAHFLGRAHARC